MTHPLRKIQWLDRCIETNKFHISQMKDEQHWTIQKTAESLDRSVGSISQDILLANWSRSHEKELRKFRTMSDALEFVREKEREFKLGDH
jgi:hypothetical protein